MQWKEHAVNVLITNGAICSIVLLIYAMKGVYPFGHQMIMWGDLPQQGIAWLYDAYDVFTGMASPYFTWRYSGGLDGNVSLISNLFDLPILLTCRENIYQFISILLLFKMCCMGIAMYFFSCRYSVERKYRILASVLYGTGSCVLIHYQIGNVMLDIAILFPFLMAGFYDLMENNRPFLYIALLAFCIYKNSYVSFMLCMYLFSISIPYFYFCVPRDMFRIKCRNFLISTCIALGLSSASLLSMAFSLEDSSRIAWDYIENTGFWGKYLHAVSDNNVFSFFHATIMLCFFMGSALPIRSIRMAWKKMKGTLRFHQIQLMMILAAVIIPGTEILWHGGSHTQWIVRFAFILNFVFLEIFLVLRQHRMISLSEPAAANQREDTLYTAILFLVGIVAFDFLMREFYTSTLATLLLFTILFLVLWLVFYSFSLNCSMKFKSSVIFAALILEIFLNCFHWIAPEFEKLSRNPEQVSPDWNTEDFCRYIPMAANLSKEIDRNRISPLWRTRDIDNSFNSNYAAISGTCSIANYRGTIPIWIQNLYHDLGYGNEYVRILDSGGTLFSDALLGIHSTFTTGRALSSEFYQEDTSIHSVRWYWNRFTLPTGLVLNHGVEKGENVFDYQNHLFRAVTGKEENLFREISVPLDSAHQIPIWVDGRQELYLYIDRPVSKFREKQIESLSVNGITYKIPNLTEEENESYPVEFNNRLLDLGTFENETVLLELKSSKEQDPVDLHIGLLDLRKMKTAFEDIRQENFTDKIEIGISSLSLHQISHKGGTLFLPILYSGCWQCKVNGTPADIRPVLGGFIGIPVEAGENEIRMEYIPKTHAFGHILACVSAMLGIFVFILWKKGQWQQRCKGLDYGLGVSYLACSALFVLLIYLLPILTFLSTYSAMLYNTIAQSLR